MGLHFFSVPLTLTPALFRLLEMVHSLKDSIQDVVNLRLQTEGLYLSTPNSYVESLASNVIVREDEAFG